MVLHPWLRIQEIANLIGLILGAMGLILIGSQRNNKLLKNIGILSLIIFWVLLFILTILLIRDYIIQYPEYTKKFLGIIPF